MPEQSRNKLLVEAALFESGRGYTILQPTAYMQNLLAGWPAIVERGVYTVPYAAETKLGMVDLEDVAEAASLVLTEAGHTGAIYELAGPEALTQTEVAKILSQTLGRPVRVEVVARSVWRERARASGMGEYQIETLVRMFQYYEQFGFGGNPRILTHLIGRPPTSLEAFVERTGRMEGRA